MGWLNDMAQIFPLMRGGGAFLVAIGVGILLGALGSRRMRIVGLIAGAGIGILIMAVGGATRLIFAGLPYPAIWQWGVLGLALAVEGYLVSLVVRRFPDLDARQFWLWMLFVVGAHFLILGFSHGPICAALALVCMANAMVGLRLQSTDVRVFWGIDGALKIAAGAAMLAVSYA
jgi:hypothetical protein